MDANVKALRRAYDACLADPELIWSQCADDVVLHIAGDHPLSGDYVGIDAARGFMAAVDAATQGRNGFTVTSAFTDDSGNLLLVEGTAFHGEEPFVRTVVHLLRFEDGKLVEFWDNPFDLRAENRFWSARIPRQRRTPVSETVRPAARPHPFGWAR